MNIGNIITYGTFDTKITYPLLKETTERAVAVFEFEFLLSCDGESIIDDKRYVLSPQAVLLRKPRQKCRSRLGFRCLFFHLQVDENGEYYRILEKLPNFYGIIESTKYKRAFETLIHHLAVHNGENDDLVTSKILEIIYYLQIDAKQNSFIPPRPRPTHNENLLKTIAYMQENYSEPLPLKKLASVAGYSPNYFETIFKKTFNCTPQDYLLELRLNTAKQLLVAPDLTIAEIAYQCGFNSQAYFTFQFRKSFRLTPREYRKNTIPNYIL